jgi:hypothetical protein
VLPAEITNTAKPGGSISPSSNGIQVNRTILWCGLPKTIWLWWTAAWFRHGEHYQVIATRT